MSIGGHQWWSIDQGVVGSPDLPNVERPVPDRGAGRSAFARQQAPGEADRCATVSVRGRVPDPVFLAVQVRR